MYIPVEPVQPSQPAANPVTTVQPASPIATIQPITTSTPNRESSAATNPLTNIAPGTIVEGFVVNRDAQNNPIVRTVIGDLRVTSEVFLKTGSEVVFRVDTSQSSLARIVSVDGLTPQDYNAQNVHGITKDTISTSLFQRAVSPQQPLSGKPEAAGLPALILQTQSQESLIAATIKSSQGGPLPMVAQLAQLRAGTPIRLTILDLKLPPLPIALASLPDSGKLASLLPQKPITPQAPAAPHAANQAAASASPAAGRQPIPSAATPEHHTAAASPAPAAAPTANDAATPTVARLPSSPQAALPNPAASPHAIYTANESILTKPIPIVQQPAEQPAPSQAQPLTQEQSERVASYGKVLPQPLSPHAPSHSYAAASAQSATPALHPQVSTQALLHHAIDAAVIGHEADGANILHTAFATIKLYTAQPLPTGTTLVMHVAPEHHEASPGTAPTTTPATEENFISESSKTWKTLEDVIAVLTKTNADIAQEVTQRLPTLNTKLASGLLFFMAAIKNGDVTELLGKRAVRLLESLAPELLSKLRKEVTQIQTNSSASPLPNWLVIQLPLMFGQELHHARLYIGKNPEGTDVPEGGHGQRFILEVGMSQLGPMQLDGFVRRHNRTQNFDLQIRSQQPLDDEVMQGIRTIFVNSMDATGMHGNVLFQAGGQHFVRPEQGPKKRPDATSMNTILA